MATHVATNEPTMDMAGASSIVISLVVRSLSLAAGVAIAILLVAALFSLAI
jgi:hypothetical protein